MSKVIKIADKIKPKLPECVYGVCGTCGNSWFVPLLNPDDCQYIVGLECTKCKTISELEVIKPDQLD
jgi:hypothetical protein